MAIEPAMSNDPEGMAPNTTRGYAYGYPSVAPTVGNMTSSQRPKRLAYDEASSPEEMSADCRAAGRNLRLRRAAASAVGPAPSIHFDDYPREVGKRDIRISDAAARLANALHLHLD